MWVGETLTLLTLIRDQLRLKRLTARYRRWLARQGDRQPRNEVVMQS